MKAALFVLSLSFRIELWYFGALVFWCFATFSGGYLMSLVTFFGDIYRNHRSG